MIMDMLNIHIDNASNRLNKEEVYKILGVRNYNFGLECFFNNDFNKTIDFLLLAVKYRYKLLPTFIYIFRAMIKKGMYFYTKNNKRRV